MTANYTLTFILGNTMNTVSMSGETKAVALNGDTQFDLSNSSLTNGERNIALPITGSQPNVQPVNNEAPRVGRRVNLVTKHFKDILIRSYPNFVQVIMSPVTTGLRHTVNANVCDELIDIMKQLLPDDECRAVLITGIGPTFCQGESLHWL